MNPLAGARVTALGRLALSDAKRPEPDQSNVIPPERVDAMESNTLSTALAESARLKPAELDTAAIRSFLFTVSPCQH